jgi:hypothetical protein
MNREGKALCAGSYKNFRLPRPRDSAEAVVYSQLTIQGMPNRSVTMPKPAAQKVFW